LKVENDEVSLIYKDYKENNAKKTLTLPAMDFIRSFMTHVLPSRYVRIRYYGIISNRNKKSRLEDCYEFFELERKLSELSDKWEDIFLEVTGIDIHICPECGEGQMIVKGGIEKNFYRPPPFKTA
jgi:predicted dienelactone hydrolase